MSPDSRIRQILAELTDSERLEVYSQLKAAYGIHPMEAHLKLTSDEILSALQKMKEQNGMPWRMLRGSLADLLYGVVVLPSLTGWTDVPFNGDMPYDYLLESDSGERISLQIKLQRSEAGQPLDAKKSLGQNMFVVETQRTRGGKKGEKKTRPYRFGDFDILAVSMFPSTGRWETYMYTVAKWLLPHPTETGCLNTFQPVAKAPNADWTDSLEQAIEWLKSGQQKTITVTQSPPSQQKLAL
jgi:hypothetical protein